MIRSVVEVDGPDLVGRTGHDLLGGQDPLLDQAADDVVGDAELRGGLRMVSHAPSFSAER